MGGNGPCGMVQASGVSGWTELDCGGGSWSFTEEVLGGVVQDGLCGR